MTRLAVTNCKKITLIKSSCSVYNINEERLKALIDVEKRNLKRRFPYQQSNFNPNKIFNTNK